MSSLEKDIQELILDRLTPKQLDRWNESTMFYEDLLPKITKARWASEALKEIERRSEERIKAHFADLDRREQRMYAFLKKHSLKGWKAYQGQAYLIVNKSLKPGQLHSYNIEFRGDNILLTSTDGWKVHVHGIRTVQEILELTRIKNQASFA